ncbi:MAG: hypothetical protein BWY06_03155 [Candidatus Latescibacteria bacterium ADurb.Bin168]|nr:MAG: hypothetical protein BWY06_03155 [Candidatus Latescibacteria bacterium ADurb.Bin168]
MLRRSSEFLGEADENVVLLARFTVARGRGALNGRGYGRTYLSGGKADRLKTVPVETYLEFRCPSIKIRSGVHCSGDPFRDCDGAIREIPDHVEIVSEETDLDIGAAHARSAILLEVVLDSRNPVETSTKGVLNLKFRAVPVLERNQFDLYFAGMGVEPLQGRADTAACSRIHVHRGALRNFFFDDLLHHVERRHRGWQISTDGVLHTATDAAVVWMFHEIDADAHKKRN